MESELVSSSFSNKGEERSEETELSPFTYTSYFYKCLPYYLAIGMTPDEFWRQDCTLTESYRKAFQIKNELHNEQSWLQGMYNYEALCDVLPAIVSLGKSKVREYSNEPYPITKEETKKRKVLKEQNEYKLAKEKIQSFVLSVNKKFKKKEE